MFLMKGRKYMLVLMLLVAILSGCTRVTSFNCPVYPIGGQKVADELKNIPYEGYENFWEHQARLYKLKQELDLCQ